MSRTRKLVVSVAFALGAIFPLAIQSANAMPVILSSTVSADGSTLIIQGIDLGPGTSSITLGPLSGLVGVPNAAATKSSCRLRHCCPVHMS